MKIFAALVFSFLLVFSAQAQVKATLNEKLSASFKQNFSDWKAENGENVFYPMIANTWKFNPEHHKASEVSDLHSVWIKGEKRVSINMELANADQSDSNFNMFIFRNISPPSYKIEDLGDKAYLVKFHDRVEIAFVKHNVFTYFYYSFPSKLKKTVSIGHPDSYKAPKEEVEFALKAARLIAAEIDANQTIETLTGVKISQPAD
jgi:hypothetical protein